MNAQTYRVAWNYIESLFEKESIEEFETWCEEQEPFNEDEVRRAYYDLHREILDFAKTTMERRRREERAAVNQGFAKDMGEGFVVKR